MYDDNADKPDPILVDSFEPFDDFTLVPADGQALFEEADQSIQLDLSMINLADGAN